jgi:hypothetical protein
MADRQGWIGAPTGWGWLLGLDGRPQGWGWFDEGETPTEVGLRLAGRINAHQSGMI